LQPGSPYHAVVTIRLASDGPQTVHAETIGAAWLAVAGRILAEGVASRYDDLPVREISLVTLVVDRPDPRDEIIASRAEPERLAWMHANFTDHGRVAALGDADSYATRLFDYEHSGRDQVAWVVDRLRRDPAGRLLLTVKSAHVYETERAYLLGVLTGERHPAPPVQCRPTWPLPMRTPSAPLENGRS
jgi:hypothetical protein